MKRRLDWNQYHNLCLKLANKIKHAEFMSIYGVPRGGLIPATIISHYLDIPLVTELNIDKTFGVYDIIVIDDIADKGNTLKSLDYRVRTATLFVNEKNCKHYPDFFVEKTTSWIEFPYEYEKDTISEVNYIARRYA